MDRTLDRLPVKPSGTPTDSKGIAGRDASGKVLNVLAQNIPWLLGGSADLGTSNKTTLTFEGAGDLEPGTLGGRNLHFGIREHAMAAVVNDWIASPFQLAQVTRDLRQLRQEIGQPGATGRTADRILGHLVSHELAQAA